jgi:hypothetical protein
MPIEIPSEVRARAGMAREREILGSPIFKSTKSSLIFSA